MDLKEYLLINDLTQAQFAKQINRARTTVCKFVHKELNPSERTARQIEIATSGAVTANDLKADVY